MTRGWSLGVDIQLKILQVLPPLLQNYPEELQGALLGEALLICANLQGSKMGVVNNTAAASTSVPKRRHSFSYRSMLRDFSVEPDCDIGFRQGGYRRRYDLPLVFLGVGGRNRIGTNTA